MSKSNINIKKTHRELKEDITENQMLYTDPNSDALENALIKIDNTFKGATMDKTSDIISDQQILFQIALLGTERIKNLHCEFRSFKNIDFMNKIKRAMKSGRNANANETLKDDENDESEYTFTRENLLKFNRNVLGHFKIIQKPTFLLGSLDKEVPVVQRKQRKARETNTEEVVRTNIAEVKTGETNDDRNKTVGEVERVFKYLLKWYKKCYRGQPLSFYEFIINPNSFSRSIENLFYVSFLVKDGYVKLSLDKNNLPVLEPLVEDDGSIKKNSVAKPDANATMIQSMISLSKDEWKELIEVFNIKFAIIPEARQKGANKND